eukprot:2152190-Rhodomonas_salina.2
MNLSSEYSATVRVRGRPCVETCSIPPRSLRMRCNMRASGCISVHLAYCPSANGPCKSLPQKTSRCWSGGT